MAKIGNLQIGTSKIQLGAINAFYDAGGTGSVTVTNPTSGPNIIFYDIDDDNKTMSIDYDHGETKTYAGSVIGAIARFK